ncbi:MAG: diguanylate cyclase [Candidatus Bipolaricaulia bacterium]
MSEKKRKIARLSENLENLKDWLFEVDGGSNLKNSTNGKMNISKTEKGGLKGFALLGSDGVFSFVNDSFADLFGFENSEELLGKNWQTLYDSDRVKKFTRTIMPDLNEEGRWKGKVVGKARDGSRIYHCLELAETTDGGIVWQAERCPEKRKQLEQTETEVQKRLVQLREGVARLQEASTKGDVYNTTLQVTEKILNPEVSVLYLEKDQTFMAKGNEPNCNEVEFPNELCRDLSSLTLKKDRVVRGGDLTDYSQIELPEQRYRSFISSPVDGKGTLQVVSSKESFFTEEDVNLLQILAQHVGERLARAEIEGDLRHQAIHDQLTGLYNRHYLKEVLTKEVERAQRYGHTLSFLMIDINEFKEVNDRYSHNRGDKVLVRIGDMLQENVREVDTVVRYGGDEFLILLPETGDGSRKVVKRLKRKMENWNETNELLDFPLTIAIGSSNFDPKEELSVDEKIKEADHNMYKDKRESVN